MTHLADHIDSLISHLLVIVVQERAKHWEHRLSYDVVAFKTKFLRKKLCQGLNLIKQRFFDF